MVKQNLLSQCSSSASESSSRSPTSLRFWVPGALNFASSGWGSPKGAGRLDWTCWGSAGPTCFSDSWISFLWTMGISSGSPKWLKSCCHQGSVLTSAHFLLSSLVLNLLVLFWRIPIIFSIQFYGSTTSQCIPILSNIQQYPILSEQIQKQTERSIEISL